ncbi:hypothetical protein, partial [Rhodococcus wratislaviensis]|uniref:hypothetical protein n=1 Tax=Rhodococcus wratislaviensis TaxID=44752 RepID=UPI001059B64B
MLLRKIMFAKDEPVFLGGVLNTAKRHTDDDGRKGYLDDIVTYWKGFEKNSYFKHGAITADERANNTEISWMTDRAIAQDWLYGELLHFDADRRERIKNFNDETKYQCGLLWAKDAMPLTRRYCQYL